MSAQTMPTPEQAQANLFNQVWAPAFFGKLAEFNIVPSTEKEAQDLLAIAGNIAVLEAQENQVKAAQAGSFIGESLKSLEQLMGKQSTATPDVALQKQAAAYASSLMTDENLYLSTLALADAVVNSK